MAGEGPREWAPGRMVWTVFIDGKDGFHIEVFKNEKDAYAYTVHEISLEDKEKMDPADAKQFTKMVREGRDVVAMELYDTIMGDYGSERVMSFYTINKKLVR